VGRNHEQSKIGNGIPWEVRSFAVWDDKLIAGGCGPQAIPPKRSLSPGTEINGNPSEAVAVAWDGDQWQSLGKGFFPAIHDSLPET